MSHVHEGPLATYNSLTDPNLAGFFGNTRMRKHLKKSGLVNRRGEIISENQYRLNMARREHKKHVKDLLAQAIVHKTLDLERYRQVEIKKKLEEIAKIELVRRVRATRGRKGDEDVLPYLSPRSQSRPQSGKPSEASSGHRRPKSAPAPPRNRQQTSKSGYTDPYDDLYEDNDNYRRMVIYVNEDGRPVSPPPPSDRHSFSSSLRDVRHENIDTRHLYALDSEALQQYALKLSKADKGRDGASSPYLLSQIPQPPKRERARSAKSPRRSGRMSARPDSSRRLGVSHEVESPHSEGNLMLHRQEPAMMHQGEVQTLCEITMKYHGPNLTLPRDQFDPTQEVHIEQQHCGGNTLPVFKERLQAGSTFSFISRRHRGYPFSLTLYIDGRVDCRVSTCCEYKHGIGVKLGGKMGHFSLTGITGATPCYKCKLSVQAPPRSLKLKKGYRKKKTTQETDEVVTVEGTPRKVITPSTPREEKCDDDNYYDDDFEEEESKDNKYEDDFEEEEAEQSDRRHIIGLREDESRINGKTVSADVVEKQKDEERQGAVPANRNVEGYSSEDEDAEGPRSKSIEVTADIHAQKKDGSPKKRRRSSSSSSSSSSDREVTPRPKSPERKTRSPEPVKTAVVEVHTARSEESVPPRSDRSDHSTTSGSLTTETESTLESNRKQELVKSKERRNSSSSSSSTLSSDSEDEKYQRKKRDEKQRQENERRRQEEEERRKKEADEREIERKKKIEEDERRRADEEAERKRRFELQRQQSQDRLRQMEEQRKQQELERQQQLAEQNNAKEEERKRRMAEEERIQKDYERQLSFIQSQRESESTLSVETTPRETKSEVKEDAAPVKAEKRRESSSSSSSESESENEKKENSTSPFSQAVASLKSEAAEKKPRETSSSASTDTSSTSGSDTEKEKQTSLVQTMKTISEEDKVKEARRESTSSSSSSSSSSSGGEHIINKETEPEQKKIETPVVGKSSPETAKEPEKRRASSVSSDSSSGSSSESDEDNKKVQDKTERKEEEKKVIPPKVDAVQEKPKSESSSSSSGSESSSDKESKVVKTEEKEEVKIEPKVEAKLEKTLSSSSLSSTSSTTSSSYQRSESISDREFRPPEKPETPAPFGGIKHEETIIPEKETLKHDITSSSTMPPKEEKTEVVETKKEVVNESEDSSSDSSSSSDSDSDSEDEKDKPGDKKDKKPATSESDAENMHGGNDPENVAQLGTSSESQLVKAVIRQPMTHYGSILPMVKGSNAIDLNGVKLDDSQITEITNYLAEVEHVKTVTLRNCDLDDTTFQNVALSLQVTQSSPNLLNFSKNHLGAKSLQPLSVAIKNKPSVEIVILNGNPVGNVGCKVLIDALVKTKDPFPFLRRGSGYLTPSEAREQESEGKQLEDQANDTGCNIKELDLGDSKIGDAGIAEISRFLEANKTLVSLNLNGNREISPSGWERLGQALKKNKTLKTLSLDFTNIGDSGIDSLAKGLKVNTGLRSLELESAGLTDKGGQILRDLLKSNTSIIELTVVPGNDISDGTIEEIKKYLAMNNTSST